MFICAVLVCSRFNGVLFMSLFRKEGELEGVVFAHQTVWQQHIMDIFAREICLVDATYKTTCYDLPLFFLCAPTNIGYVNVATILLANERQETIEQGLEVVKEWNPTWKPTFFMSDFCVAQISALETTFPGKFISLELLVLA